MTLGKDQTKKDIPELIQPMQNAESRMLKAESRMQNAESRKQKAESRKQKAEC